jgi:hypothetical protein
MLVFVHAQIFTSDWNSAARTMSIHAQKCTRNHSNGTQWLIGTGLRQRWFDQMLLMSDQLDIDVSRELCVCVKDYGRRRVWLNSRAMELFIRSNQDSISLWKTKGLIFGGVLMEEAADAAVDLLPQLSLHDHASSIERMHRTLFAHGVVGYQETCFEASADCGSKVDAYLQVFEGCLAYRQPRVRVLLRMPAEVGVAEILDFMKQVQVSIQHHNACNIFYSNSVTMQQRPSARLTFDGIEFFMDGFIEQVGSLPCQTLPTFVRS